SHPARRRRQRLPAHPSPPCRPASGVERAPPTVAPRSDGPVQSHHSGPSCSRASLVASVVTCRPPGRLQIIRPTACRSPCTCLLFPKLVVHPLKFDSSTELGPVA